MAYMEPKYRAKSPPYKRLKSREVPPWKPGELVVQVATVIHDLPEPRRCDMQEVLLMRNRVENQVFDMMGGMNGY